MPPSSLRVPATTSSNTLASSSSNVGYAIHSPSLRARRTAPIGPSKGIGEIVRAAEAPLRATMSYGFSASTDRTVATMCVSERKPSRNEGRRGRSMRRAVRIAFSVGRPSRRKNEPGIFPAAYIRSSTSTVRGKKSTPGRSPRSAVAVTRTSVSPIRATTEPSASSAIFPVVIAVFLPPMVRRTVISGTLSPCACWGGRRRANYQWPPPAWGREVATDNRPSAPSSSRVVQRHRPPPGRILPIS